MSSAGFCGKPSAWARYAERQDFYLGYSYALAAAFTVFAILLSLRQLRRELGGILVGVNIIGVLCATGCFLIGCCGSPMLIVYLSLFGSSFLGIIKPIIAGITTVSIALSSFYIIHRSRRACCPPVVDGERISPARNASELSSGGCRVSVDEPFKLLYPLDLILIEAK